MTHAVAAIWLAFSVIGIAYAMYRRTDRYFWYGVFGTLAWIMWIVLTGVALISLVRI